MHMPERRPVLLPSEPRGRRESARSLIGWWDFHFDPAKCTKCAENTLFRASRQNQSRYRSETCGAGRRVSKSFIISFYFVRIDQQSAELSSFNFDPPFCTRNWLCHFSRCHVMLADGSCNHKKCSIFNTIEDIDVKSSQACWAPRYLYYYIIVIYHFAQLLADICSLISIRPIARERFYPNTVKSINETKFFFLRARQRAPYLQIGLFIFFKLVLNHQLYGKNGLKNGRSIHVRFWGSPPNKLYSGYTHINYMSAKSDG